MTITPVATTDVANYVSSPDGTKATTAVVIAVNPDGSSIGGSGTLSTQVQGNAASGATDVGNPVKIAGKYNVTLPTFTDGQRGDVQVDAAGNLRSHLVSTAFTAVDGQANTTIAFVKPFTSSSGGTTDRMPLGVVPFAFNGTSWDRLRGDVRGIYTSSYTYSHITTATTTVVKASAGVLKSVTVNTKGTVASAVTVYDNTTATGTVVAVIDSLNLSGQFLFDITMATGITVVTTGTVAPDITVAYR